MRWWLSALIWVWGASVACAHDTWVQTNTNLVRAGNAIHVDLMLGNHGNNHRDFKLAGKLALDGTATCAVIAPDGKRYDLKDRLIDTGYTPQEGFWTATFVSDAPGLYIVAHTLDKVMSYAPERAIKSAKTFFVASKTLDKIPATLPGFDRPLGHPLELVPDTNPVVSLGPGVVMGVRLLYKGKPLPGAKVAFIPRGEVLKGGMDERYERVTDGQGRARFEPKSANYYLVVAHREEPNEGGRANDREYTFTKYSATLTVYVPQICPCCGG